MILMFGGHGHKARIYGSLQLYSAGYFWFNKALFISRLSGTLTKMLQHTIDKTKDWALVQTVAFAINQEFKI